MMDFVNRHEEMKILERVCRTPGFQFLPIYGRRRIGKTRLIQEFIRNKKAVYFLAESVSESEQLKNLGREIGEHFTDRILAENGFRDWRQFFSYIGDRARERIILVIDEFPYLVGANNAMASIFQKGIDEQWSKTNLLLILMGSSIGMMEKEVLLYKAPLYGRRTGSMEVKEMCFPDLGGFFPQASFDDRVQFFSVFGAVPAYLEKVDPRRGPLHNIDDLILERGSYLYDEVEFILREELREPRNYFAILRAVAQGKRKLSEIINETGFEKSMVGRYLDILRSLRFVDKAIPVTEPVPEKSKRGLYKLHDRFFSFWFKYVLPNRSRLEIGGADYVLKLIGKSFEQHVSQAYEEVCRDLCRTLMASGLMSYTAIGSWWSKEAEMDIVALDEESGTAWFGECKWSRKKVGDDVYRDLAGKSKMVEWRQGKRKDKFILFSRSGFTQRMLDLAGSEKVILVHGERVVQ